MCAPQQIRFAQILTSSPLSYLFTALTGKEIQEGEEAEAGALRHDQVLVCGCKIQDIKETKRSKQMKMRVCPYHEHDCCFFPSFAFVLLLLCLSTVTLLYPYFHRHNLALLVLFTLPELIVQAGVPLPSVWRRHRKPYVTLSCEHHCFFFVSLCRRDRTLSTPRTARASTRRCAHYTCRPALDCGIAGAYCQKEKEQSDIHKAKATAARPAAPATQTPRG